MDGTGGTDVGVTKLAALTKCGVQGKTASTGMGSVSAQCGGLTTEQTRSRVRLENLTGLTNLRFLDLDDSLITGEGLRQMSGVHNLETLASEFTDHRGRLSHVKELKRLRVLELPGTSITDEGLTYLKELQQPVCGSMIRRSVM